MNLGLNSSIVKNIVQQGIYLFYFTAVGVDIVDPVTRSVVGWMTVANTTCGCVNDNGVYIGTTNGVFFLPTSSIGIGDKTSLVVAKFSTTTVPTVLNNAILDMAGLGTMLTIATSGGVDYFPDSLGTIKYTYTLAGATKVDISGIYLGYVIGGKAYTIVLPIGNWTTGVALSSSLAVINDISFGADDCLFAGTSTGVIGCKLPTIESISVVGVFGASSNVNTVYADVDTTMHGGTLAYGTSVGDGTGRMGILSMKSKGNLVNHPGDFTVVYCQGLEVIGYKDNLDYREDAVASSVRLNLVGVTVKTIVRSAGYIFHFTESGVDVHRITDGVRVCYAYVSGTVCGAVNDNGVYFGTGAGGIKIMPWSSVISGWDQSLAVTLAYGTATVPAIQAMTIVSMAGIGSSLIVATSAGVDFLPIASTVYHRTVIGGALAVSMDTTRIAYSEGGYGYWAPYPIANWDLTFMTLVAGTPGTAVRATAFGKDLFVATNDGIMIWNTVNGSNQQITLVLGALRDVTAIHPTTVAGLGVGLLAYGISYGDGSGKFGVLDLSII